ncbi:unnamed protein product [Auanema sp. JU1783]|nr:unnamed protein product [Auanema sp. JU1783]
MDFDPCEYQPQIFLEWKMIFVGIIGLITALVSILHNCLMFYTFNTSHVLRKRNLTYLMWISGCDVFISLCYIAIMCMQVYTDYYESLFLFYLWHYFIRFAFTVSHITLSGASFLLMAASIERYLQSTGDNRAIKLFRLLATHRTVVVIICFVASIILKGTVFFEVAVVTYPNCTDLSSMGLVTVRLFPSPVADIAWKFWIRKIVTVFLPFVVLAYFNAAIVMNVRKTDRDQTVKALVLFVTVGQRPNSEGGADFKTSQKRCREWRGEATRLRNRLRTVTRMLVMVVCCYLLSNIIDVVVSFIETIDFALLEEYGGVYAVMTDISSFLPILACALRLPIYCVNDKVIRREVIRKVHKLIQRACVCCPGLSVVLRFRRKLYDPEREAEKLFGISSPRESIPHNHLEIKSYGMGSLIMARASLSTQLEYQQLTKFQNGDVL